MKLNPTTGNLNLPWRIKTIGSCPHIVDAKGKPVCAFGNQMRHRGFPWAWRIARLIVKQVNRATPKEPAP